MSNTIIVVRAIFSRKQQIFLFLMIKLTFLNELISLRRLNQKSVIFASTLFVVKHIKNL